MDSIDSVVVLYSFALLTVGGVFGAGWVNERRAGWTESVIASRRARKKRVPHRPLIEGVITLGGYLVVCVLTQLGLAVYATGKTGTAVYDAASIMSGLIVPAAAAWTALLVITLVTARRP